MYNEVEGDLIKLAKQGAFDVIVHGCNIYNTMGAGIAPQMAKAFGCNKFELEHKEYYGDINKLGCIDYQEMQLRDGKVVDWDYDPNSPLKNQTITVVNAYTQGAYNPKLKPFSYPAFNLCMLKINTLFKYKRIGLPQIGAGLAGGDWDFIKPIIKEQLKDCNTTVVIYKP